MVAMLDYKVSFEADEMHGRASLAGPDICVVGVANKPHPKLSLTSSYVLHARSWHLSLSVPCAQLMRRVTRIRPKNGRMKNALRLRQYIDN